MKISKKEHLDPHSPPPLRIQPSDSLLHLIPKKQEVEKLKVWDLRMSSTAGGEDEAVMNTGRLEEATLAAGQLFLPTNVQNQRPEVKLPGDYSVLLWRHPPQ